MSGHRLSLPYADWPTASDGLQPNAVADRTGAIDPIPTSVPFNSGRS
jgi:hypothetical protein